MNDKLILKDVIMGYSTNGHEHIEEIVQDLNKQGYNVDKVY